MKSTPRSSAPEQLALLDESGPVVKVPLQFRLSERTRRIGLAHVAEIRRQLQEQAARQRVGSLVPRPSAELRQQHRDAA